MMCLAYVDNSIKLFWVPDRPDASIELFFYCPYANEGLPNLLNVFGSPLLMFNKLLRSWRIYCANFVNKKYNK